MILHYAETKLGESVPCQAAVSVSKKRFKRAVDRNRIKRLLREAWRIEKAVLEKSLHGQEKQLGVVFIYAGNEIPTFKTIHKCMQSVLKKMPYLSDSHENDELTS